MIHPKVKAYFSTATITGAVTWVLVTYVPAFHSGLPGPVEAFLPGLVAIAMGFVGGWLKKESDTTVSFDLD